MGRAVLLSAVLLSGCALAGDLPELPEPQGLRAVQVSRADDAEALRLKLDNARLIAEIERVKAEAAAEVRRAKAEQFARERAQAEKAAAEIEALKRDLADKAAVAREAGEQAIYPLNKMTLAVLAAALACAAYAYKRMSIGAAVVGLAALFAIYATALAGQWYPRYLAMAPLPLMLVLLFAAWRYGVLKRALVACVRGVELAPDNRAVKTEIVMQPGSADIELVRPEIDQATVQRARRADRERG